jgi:hypothetical protein
MRKPDPKPRRWISILTGILQPTFFGLGILELFLGILFHKYLREQAVKE